MRRIILTVDVEALPARQPSHHVERLIWGRYGDKQAGIEEMMDVAEKYGCAMTFFVDFCERFLHPGALEQAARRIVERGHDLQLHAHPEFMSAEFWSRFELPDWNTSLSGYTPERAKPLMDFLVQSARECGGEPVAFRGGAFRFNHEILRAMSEAHLPLSFNYNVKSAHQPNNEQNRSLFAWSNGVIEVPTGHLEHREFLRSFNLNLMDFSDQDSVREYLDGYFQRFGENAALVLVMHSWSFCDRNEQTGYFELKDDRLRQSFETFLRELPAGYTVVTASDLARDLASGAISATERRDTELANRDRYPPRDAVTVASKPRSPSFDEANGTDTETSVRLEQLTIASPNARLGHPYQPTPEGALIDAVEFLAIDKSRYRFVDLGCGKGRTLITARKLGFKSALGIEFAAELAAIARANLDALGIQDCEVRLSDAADYRFSEEALVVYVYNAFARPVLEAVLANLAASGLKDVYLVYRNPVDASLIHGSSVLTYLGSPPTRGGPDGIHVWTTRDATPSAQRSRVDAVASTSASPSLFPETKLAPFQTTWANTEQVRCSEIDVRVTYRRAPPFAKNCLVCAFDFDSATDPRLLQQARLARSRHFEAFDYLPAPASESDGLCTASLKLRLQSEVTLKRIGLARWNDCGPITIVEGHVTFDGQAFGNSGGTSGNGESDIEPSTSPKQLTETHWKSAEAQYPGSPVRCYSLSRPHGECDSGCAARIASWEERFRAYAARRPKEGFDVVPLRLALPGRSVELNLFEHPLSILDIPRSIEEYDRHIGDKSRNMTRKATRAGYSFRSDANGAEYLQDIFDIRNSNPTRMGHAIPEYWTKPAFAPTNSAGLCDWHDELFYGVFLGQTLVAYITLFLFGEIAQVNQILGHDAHLSQGVMNLLMRGVVEQLQLTRSQVRGINYLYPDAKYPLGLFKRGVGLDPCKTLTMLGAPEDAQAIERLLAPPVTDARPTGRPAKSSPPVTPINITLSEQPPAGETTIHFSDDSSKFRQLLGQLSVGTGQRVASSGISEPEGRALHQAIRDAGGSPSALAEGPSSTAKYAAILFAPAASALPAALGKQLPEYAAALEPQGWLAIRFPTAPETAVAQGLVSPTEASAVKTFMERRFRSATPSTEDYLRGFKGGDFQFRGLVGEIDQVSGSRGLAWMLLRKVSDR